MIIYDQAEGGNFPPHTLPTDWLDGWRRLYPPDGGWGMKSRVAEGERRIASELAERDEEGRRVRRVGRWCPHGARYRVVDSGDYV